jgi:hypothetical protein
MKKDVLIYDDDSGFIDECISRVKKIVDFSDLFNIKAFSNDEFREEIKVLEKRQKEFRDEKKWNNESLKIDETSIFIIEFDLVRSVAFLTGEYVSYLTRCFSKCGIIIGMNQFGTNSFDLTLRGHPESFCDLNIGSDQLDNAGLWGKENPIFRPWYWPMIPKYLESFQKKIDDIKDKLNEPILKTLELEEIIDMLPRHVISYLGSTPTTTTFRNFVYNSGFGLKPKDKCEDDDLIARIAVARISKWIERMILPGQDILVDAPHLVYRYPSLLNGNLEDLDTWNNTTKFEEIENLNIKHDDVEVFRFKKDFWLSKYAWFWNKISNDQKILEVSEPWKRNETNFRFCEDSSRFYNISDCIEFMIESDSPYLRRYVFRGNLEDARANYQPRVNLIQSS